MYDEIKIEKLQEFVALLESDELDKIEGPPITEPNRQKLADRVKLQIAWLEDKVYRDKLG